MMKCNHRGCDNDAEWQLGWYAYAAGHPRTKDTRVEAYVGIAVCFICKGKVQVSEVLTPAGRAIINNKLAQARRAPLDFTSAGVMFHPLVDGKLYMPEGAR